MHSFRAVYDVNSTGNPFDESFNDSSQLPHDALNQFAGLHTPIETPPPITPAMPTTLHQLASFFRPRSTPAVHSIPKDNNVFGDTMIIPSPSNTTRLYFINLNGLNLQKKAAKFRDLCEEMRNANVDLFAAAEHNLDTNKFAVRQSLQDIAQKSFQHHCIQTATSTTTADKFYKPGGTLIMTQGDLVGRIKDRGSDQMGRWTWIKLVGKNQRLVTVISAYQVCTRPTNKTGTTAYHQQECLLRLRGVKNANPRKYFQRDLNEFIRICKTRTESVILVGDFNEPLTEKSSMAKIAANHGLVDILFQRNSHLQEPPTYARGSNRIDYALLSPDLVGAVQLCGYEPFQQRIKSDHRGLYIDFNTSMLFGNDTQTLGPAALRDFTAKSPANNSTYISAKHAHLTQQGFFGHLARLQSLPNGDHALAERLDANLRISSAAAGNKVKRFYKPWWSQSITKARAVVDILQRQLSGFKTNTSVRTVLTDRIINLSLDLVLPVTMTECQDLLATKIITLRALEQNSLEVRHEELSARASLASDLGDKNVKQRIDQIRSSEAHAAMYRKVKAVRGKFNQSGFTSIEVPTSWPPAHSDPALLPALDDPKKATDWTTVDLPDEIVYYLLTRNRLHFGQAHGTPFTLPLLSEKIDWQASTATAELILDGEYKDSELSDLQALLIKHCQSQHVDVLPLPITEAEFVSKFRGWKEGTSTSPSGLHLGHYKALVLRHDGDPTTDEGKAIESQRKELIRAHVSMINYALRHAYSYTRWKNVVNVMIEKEPGNSKVHRLRVIHIYEADYNFLLQAKWRNMISHAETNSLLHPGQYGSRPGRDALIPALIEELKNEICYASRKSLINFDNDAASCYDRIIPALASLIGRKFGLHRNVVFVHATTLEETKYKLKTSMGVSDEFYENCQAFPIYGTGQGSGNSPAIWCIVSSVLFSCHQENAHGAYFCTPDKEMSVSLSMIGFVDDSTGQVNSFCDNTQSQPELLRAIMQLDAQLWSDLLWISGGLLELSKCSFHHIHFDFAPDGTAMMRSGTFGAPLQVHDKLTDQLVTIKAKSVYTPHKTLGHFKAPAGQNRTQLQRLRSSSDSYAKLVATSPCNRMDSWYFYTAIYLKSLGYVLPNCFFSHKQLHKVQQSALRAFLAKCGYNRNTHRLIVFAPIRYGGCGFLALYLIQGEGQILSFLKNWRTKTDCSKLLRIAVSWTQLHLGTSFGFLADTTTALPHMPGRWLKSLRNFLAYIGGTIELDTTYLPPLQRHNDMYIMDMVLQCGVFSEHEIRQINHCRMFLQAITLSDICLADGETLDHDMLLGSPGPSSSTSTWVHINQDRPHEPSWKLWRQACSQWSLRDKLYHPLGDWLYSSDRLRRQWPFYFDHSTGDLFVRNPTGFTRCIAIDSIRFSPISELEQHSSPSSFPVSARPTIQGEFWIAIIRPLVIPPFCYDPPSTFLEFLTTLELWERELFSDLTMQVDCFEFIQLVNSQLITDSSAQLITVSDGSDDSGSMTFGWAVALPNGQRLATCAGPAYGPSGSSFRAEGYGFLSVSRFLVRLFEFCSVKPEWIIQMMTDNQGLLTRLESSYPHPEPFPNLTLLSDWDLTHEINQSIRTFGRKPNLVHVKGHQDTHTPYSELSLDAQLNVDADLEAGAYQCTYPAQRPLIPRLPSNPAQLRIKGKVICARLKQRIREAATVPEYLAYVAKRFGWDEATADSVDWPAYTQAIGRFRPQRIQITKLCHDLLPTARWANRYDSLTTAHCLHCGELEDRDHIIRCTFGPRQEWRNKLLSTIRKAHDSDSSDHYLTDILVTYLDSWFRGTKINNSRFPRRYHRLIAEQSAIGWRHLFNGHFSTQWRLKQDYFIRRRKISTLINTGAGWTLRTLTILWSQFFLLWKSRNEAVHGHDITSQNQARKRHLRLEMEFLHEQRDKVLACDKHAFVGDTPEELNHFLEISTASHVQNWIHIWKPRIVYSIQSAKELSLKGVRTLSSYFASTSDETPRPINDRSHRTARPRTRQPRALPQPSFRFRNLRSFFAIPISATAPLR
jgi:hypothetical protein